MAIRENIDYARVNDITIEEVRACETFAHLTDEQAREVIRTLKQFTLIAFDFYRKNKKKALAE